MDFIDKINNYWVCQSNMFMETCYNMTTIEQKIIRIVASMVRKDDTDFQEYSFDALTLCKLLKVDKKNIYRELEKVSRRLMTRYVKLKRQSKKDCWKMYHIIKTAEFNDGIFSIRIDDEMKVFYLFLQEFTRYKLVNVLGFNHTYSFKFYELLKQYENFGYREVELEVLKEYLDIKGKYDTYYDFKKRILIPVQKEINSKTDIYFEFEEIRRGRRVVAIKFIIKLNTAKKEQIKTEKVLDVQKVNKFQGDIEKTIGDTISKDKISLWIKQNKEDDIDFYLDNWTMWDYKTKATKAGFFIDLVDNNRPIPSGKKGTRTHLDKPAQATNYEQRDFSNYTDEDWMSFYDNIDLIKKNDDKK